MCYQILFLLPVRIGQETLMDESLPDDEIEIELAPIAVQLAYVQQVRWWLNIMHSGILL